MKYSSYQNSIFNFVKKSSDDIEYRVNLIINAVAGSGKSTTIRKCIDFISEDYSVFFLAFNTSIVEELKSKISKPNVDVRTLHSYGGSIIKKHRPKSILNKNKYRDIFRMYSQARNLQIENMEDFEIMVVKIVDLLRFYVGCDIEEILEIYGVDATEQMIAVAKDILQMGIANSSMHDFTDMIYLPIVCNMNGKSYDFVFIDEAQDLSHCQRLLLAKSINKYTGRFIAVGDRNQAIYFFAGSSSNSLDKLKEMGKCIELPLSVCYRCDKEIVNMAKNYVKEIEYRDDAMSGIVDEEAKLDDVKNGDLIMCRNTAPLVSTCMKLLSKGKAASIIGRDIGMSLIWMIKKSKSSQIKDLIIYLDQQIDDLVNKLQEDGLSKKEIEESKEHIVITDKIRAIKHISRDMDTVGELVKKIEDMFSEKGKGIILSTIHKAKGLEADNAYLIERDLIPAKYCYGNKELMKQENNLMYIAITRGKHKFGIIK